MILDTSFVIDLFRNNSAAKEKALELDRRNEPIFITSVTVFELWQGLDIKTEEKLEKINHFIESFGMMNLDPESAKRGGQIHSELVSKGSKIDPEDSMIAGIAIHNSQAVLTRDEHYSRIRGPRIETY